MTKQTNKSHVLSVRISDGLNASLDVIAKEYNVSTSFLVSAVLTSFVKEYSDSLVDPDVIENSKDS